MKEAKAGRLTPELISAAKYECIDLERLRRLVASGRAVIPKNVNHQFSEIRAIGEGLRVKVNVNLGTSKDYINLDEELKKLRISEKYGADTIMDLSTGGDLQSIRKRIIGDSILMVGTVPIYEAGILKAR